jgi:multicomponent Na+:H+ antiporter subunit D
VPLIISSFGILQNYKGTNVILTILVVSFIVLLSFYLIPSTLPNIVLQNKVNNEPVFMMGEYKIDLVRLIFLICIFFIKLVSFMFFDTNDFHIEKMNFFFALYLINYFSICGIVISNNLFNIFIYLNIYSLTLYNIIADYKKEIYKKIAYKYYVNGVFASILFMFFVFIVFFRFGSPNIDFIMNNLKLVKNDYIYNISVILLFATLFFKFFSFDFYFSSTSKSSDITGMLFISILFSDVTIGFYLLWNFLYSLFDLNVVFNVFHFRELFYLIGSGLLVVSSYQLFTRKNLLANVYSFSTITIGYMIILLALNNDYAFVSMISLLINRTLTDFLFYIIVALCLHLFNKADTAILYSFYKYRCIIYTIVLSKLFFPIGLGFNSVWNFLMASIEANSYFLFIPFVIEKSAIIFILLKYYFVFCKETKDYVYLDINDRLSLDTSFVLTILLMFLLIVGISFCGNAIIKILFEYAEVN